MMRGALARIGGKEDALQCAVTHAGLQHDRGRAVQPEKPPMPSSEVKNESWIGGNSDMIRISENPGAVR